MLLSVPHLILDSGHFKLTDQAGAVVGIIRRASVATSLDPDLLTLAESPKPGRPLTQFFGSNGEFAFAYQVDGEAPLRSFELSVWDREAQMVGRVDRGMQVWVHGMRFGKFKGRRTYETGNAWRLEGTSREKLVDLWPEPLSLRWHIRFGEATELPLRMIAVAAAQPLATAAAPRMSWSESIDWFLST